MFQHRLIIKTWKNYKNILNLQKEQINKSGKKYNQSQITHYFSRLINWRIQSIIVWKNIFSVENIFMYTPVISIEVFTKYNTS